jgi:hypothetical protein
MSELQDDLARRSAHPSTRQADGPDGGERHVRDIEAVERLDTGRRAVVMHDLQSGPGNAAVQRLLEPSDGAEADADTTAEGPALQRELEDEEMPDEAAAG